MNNINREEWKIHFINLLKGKENVRKIRQRKEQGEEIVKRNAKGRNEEKEEMIKEKEIC